MCVFYKNQAKNKHTSDILSCTYLHTRAQAYTHQGN